MQVVPALNVPVEQMASCHFVSNYVLIPRQGSTRGFHEYLLPLLRSESPSSPLHHAFNACALASLGNRPDAATISLNSKALGHYTKALAATHVVLQDADLGKSDATLASVLMLGLFENITARKMGMFAWGSHIEGAIQLVKARGRKQLRTKTGLLLFIAVRTQMIIHTLTTCTAPIMGVEWWLSDAVKDEAAAQCQRLAIKTAELRAEATRLMTTLSRGPENIEIMLDMIRRAQTVDQETVNWLHNLPEYFQPRTIAWEDNVPGGDYEKAEVYPGRVDIYQDFWIASVTNMARTSRLILASVIVRCAAWVCSPVDYRTTPEYATAARTCVDTITDVIASVPYQLGWHLKRPDIIKRANLSGFACGIEDEQKGLPGYFLTWPLAILHGQDYTTDAQRSWIVGRLKFIGDELGVRYAHILSEVSHPICRFGQLSRQVHNTHTSLSKQLQVRIPSMLIRRDGLMAAPYPQAHNFEKLLSARLAPPSAGYEMNPLQQREAMQRAFVDKNKAELLAKATGTAGQSGQWVAQNWLTV
jgi:transcription factor-like protein